MAEGHLFWSKKFFYTILTNLEKLLNHQEEQILVLTIDHAPIFAKIFVITFDTERQICRLTIFDIVLSIPL